jgi:hypothetical protein
MDPFDDCASLPDSSTAGSPGNKVLFAVSKSFGLCGHCAMVFPDPQQLRYVPSGVFTSESRTWYHVPNFGRKFFDALRKYYIVESDGTESRVVIKRPEKDSYCTWVGITGNPRNYSTGGKRSNNKSGGEENEVALSNTTSGNTKIGNMRIRLASASTDAEEDPMNDSWPLLAPTDLDSPMTKLYVRNKNACLRFNAIDWFPEEEDERLII